MPASELPSVGQRIREERMKRDRSLRSLAREVGVSASLISQIENGRSRPSVSTLYAITQALGISVEDVFDKAAEVATAPAESAARLPTVVEALAASAGTDGGLGPLVRPAEREVLELDSGVTWER